MWVAAIFILLTCFLIYFQLNQNKSKSGNDGKRPGVKLGLGSSLYTIRHLVTSEFNNNPPFVYLLELQKIFGKVFIFSLLIKNTANGVLSDLQIAKTILSSADWINRIPEGHYWAHYTWGKPYGLLFGNGEYNRIGRKVTQKIYHQLGVSRLSKLEQIVTMEYQEAEEEILKDCAKAEDSLVQIGHHFQRHVLNITSQLLFSKRYERGNKEGDALVHALETANDSFRVGSSIAELWPSLSKLPFVEMKAIRIFTESVSADVKKEIQKRRQSGSYRENPEDYIDHFMIEIDRQRNEDDAEYYSDRNLMICIRDLLLAGMDTSSATTNYAMLHLAQNPHVQQHVQAEIDQVLGSRVPAFSDKANMKYTEAFLWENSRYATPAPMGARSPTKETKFCGENMSKSSGVVINYYAIHRSKDVWSDPDVFRTERFLNENQDTLINLDKIMPFGYGKRSCMGESIAKLTVFIFVVSLLQRFTFEMSDEHPPPTTKGQFGLVRVPAPFYLKVRQRKGDIQTG